MKRKILITIAAIILIIFGGLSVYHSQNKPAQKSAENNIADQGNEVNLVIDYGNGSQKTLTTSYTKSMTAFDLLKRGAEKENLTLKTKPYDTGVFIEAIGDTENGQDGKYWLYYINGEMPQVAADKQNIKVADVVEFKFEKSPF
jgi:uncharacterized protein YxeA